MKIIKPTQDHELSLQSQGYEAIFGIDEAGRGAWAGPVVAGCIKFNGKISIEGMDIMDSKMLSPTKREKIFKWLVDNFSYGVGIISHKIVDEIGILPATKLAMVEAVSSVGDDSDYLLIDAVNLRGNLDTVQENIVKGDQKIWSIAAASIIAKVTRDRIMIDYDGTYSDYGFGKHKGYGTKDHQDSLKRLGVCDIHRRSYAPIKRFLVN